MTPTDAKAMVLEFTGRPFSTVAAVEEGDGARLLEPGTGKELKLRWDELEQVEEKASPLRPGPYMVLKFLDGRQVALADVGFAFAPSTANTGQLPDLPAVMCFKDFRHLSQGIEQLLLEDGREKEALGGILLCIALLDGARGAGLDVSREERRLDKLLRALEEHGLKI